MSDLKFDERLCLEQCFKHIAYERLYNMFKKKVDEYTAERASKSTLLILLDESCHELTKIYSEIRLSNESFEYSFTLSVCELFNDMCAKCMIDYIKQARDSLAYEICNLNRPTKSTVKKSLKALVDREAALD